MTDIEKIELALHRLHAKRKVAFERGESGHINEELQRFMLALADELADFGKPPRE